MSNKKVFFVIDRGGKVRYCERLKKPEMTIGIGDVDVNIDLRAPMVQPEHATVCFGRTTIISSVNYTEVNDGPIRTTSARLKSGDKITLGRNGIDVWVFFGENAGENAGQLFDSM